MPGSTTLSGEAGATASPARGGAAAIRGVGAFVFLSAGCGLVAGLAEVGVTFVRRGLFDLNPLAPLPPDHVWQVPLADLAVFLAFGLVFAPVASFEGGRRLAHRLLAALALLAPIWAASPRIFGPAGFLLALGLATQLVPFLERHHAASRRMLRIGFPIALALPMLLAVILQSREPLAAMAESRRPFPPRGSPNVLLVVLDTVAASHLALYGYERPTSPTLDELARGGLRFERARATSSWTLPSHASLFTGRWPHDLSAGWLTPLDGAHRTLAESLGSRGYATAGFVANYWYCATSSGLARGFTTYRDYIFPRLTAFKPAVLIDRPIEGLRSADRFLKDWLDIDLLDPLVERLFWLFKFNRKPASAVHRELLDWLSSRRQPDRPFFAFLNDFDAHHPYRLAEPGLRRFGGEPDGSSAGDPFEDPMPTAGVPPTPEQAARSLDDYDNCVADLDEQLGRLVDELGRRGILERTWLIVMADHGESFGEHPDVFQHGSSLYREEVHVPLIIVPPKGEPDAPRGTVAGPVSLRDLAATIVDLAGLEEGLTFPGESLLRPDASRAGGGRTDPDGREAPLSEVVPIDPRNPDPSQWRERRWPLAALAQGDWTYIRREGDVREELYHASEDPGERRNLADDPALRPTLDRWRATLGRLTSGPLTPERFRP